MRAVVAAGPDVVEVADVPEPVLLTSPSSPAPPTP